MVASLANPTLCISIRAANQQVLLGACSAVEARHWYGVNDQLLAAGTNTCLTTSGNGTLSLAPCQGQPPQKWTLTPQGDVRSAIGVCLGATTPTAGAPVAAGPCNNAATQKWKVVQ